MSSAAVPISADRFAEAIMDLPIGNLHMKAAEIRNSILHLEHSNKQMQSYTDDGDRECVEAVRENLDVITRMEERVKLLKDEVSRRGLPWPGSDETRENGGPNGNEINGSVQSDHVRGNEPQSVASQPERSTQNNGREGEIRRMIAQDDSDEHGVHL